RSRSRPSTSLNGFWRSIRTRGARKEPPAASPWEGDAAGGLREVPSALRVDADEVAEALAERLGVDAGDRGQLAQPVRLFEVAALQPDHVATGALVGLAVDVHLAGLQALGFRVNHVFEAQGLHVPTHEADDGPEPAGGVGAQELD